MNSPLLLYDGACGLCAASVQFVLNHERAPTLVFAPLSGVVATQVRARHPHLEGVDSLVLVEGDRVRVRSAAALALTRYLRWPWPALRVGVLVPRAVRDLLYDRVARHRHRLGSPQCLLPPPGMRERFLP